MQQCLTWRCQQPVPIFLWQRRPTMTILQKIYWTGKWRSSFVKLTVAVISRMRCSVQFPAFTFVIHIYLYCYVTLE